MEEAATIEPKRGPGRPPNRPKPSMDEAIEAIKADMSGTDYRSAPTAAEPPPPAAPKGASVIALHMSRIKLEEGAGTTYRVIVPAGTDPETLRVPSYWKHVVHTLRAGDAIIAFWEDNTREFWLRVLFTSPVGAKVSPIFPLAEHEPIGALDTEEFSTVFRGMGQMWCVQRKDTGVLLKDGFPLRSEAMAYLAQYLRDMRQ